MERNLFLSGNLPCKRSRSRPRLKGNPNEEPHRQAPVEYGTQRAHSRNNNIKTQQQHRPPPATSNSSAQRMSISTRLTKHRPVFDRDELEVDELSNRPDLQEEKGDWTEERLIAVLWFMLWLTAVMEVACFGVGVNKTVPIRDRHQNRNRWSQHKRDKGLNNKSQHNSV